VMYAGRGVAAASESEIEIVLLLLLAIVNGSESESVIGIDSGLDLPAHSILLLLRSLHVMHRRVSRHSVMLLHAALLLHHIRMVHLHRTWVVPLRIVHSEHRRTGPIPLLLFYADMIAQDLDHALPPLITLLHHHFLCNDDLQTNLALDQVLVWHQCLILLLSHVAPHHP